MLDGSRSTRQRVCQNEPGFLAVRGNRAIVRLAVAFRPRRILTLAGLAALLVASLPAGGAAQSPRPFITRATLQPARALEARVLREPRRKVDLSALGAPGVPPADRLLLDLFPDVIYAAILERGEDTYSGRAWIGVIDGVPLSQAVFVRVEDSVWSQPLAAP